MIYIDTGAFLARYLKTDQFHSAATDFWEKISKDQERCFTSNHVLDETLTLLGRRGGYFFAAQRAQNFYASKVLTILRPTEQDEILAIELFEKHAHVKVSFTDCISFVLMRKNAIKRAFSFDEHFEQAGFKRVP